MKKLRILLILCLTLAVTLPAASANSWNLSGQLLAMVEQTHDYDEYTGLVSDYNRKAATTHTILTSRYHNQLVAVDEVKDGWKDAIFSTTAVYQPSELDETGYPKITRAKERLSSWRTRTLTNGTAFELTRNNEVGAVYTLTEAQMGGVTVERQAEYFYLVTLGDDNAVWAVEVTLENFNIHNMPKRGPDDVRRINEANEGLQYFAYLYPEVVAEQTSGKKSCAVYSAPDTSSYRAAKGKASVSTGDDYNLYLTVGDWSLIEYRVSLRTSRFGWAQLGNHGDETTEDLVRVPMLTAYDTYLTDDPNVSEYHQAELPAGTKLTALSHPDGWAYIYVEATVDGKITRGFVPQRDVVFDDVELPDEEAKLVGSWQMEAGGEFWDNYLRLDADGKFYGSDNDGTQPYHGTWSVVQTPAGSNLYWRGDIPTIVFRCVNGTVYRYGVEVSDDYEVTEGSYCRGMSFITCEGGTGYVSYGVYDESGSVITNENGKLILKELDVTDELNWGAYWEEEGNG